MEIDEQAFHSLVNSQSLWRTETRHEALLLAGALFKKSELVRDKLVDHILAGPTKPDSSHGADRIEALQFEFLQYLASTGPQIHSKGRDKLDSIQARHPKWTSSKYPGMSHWTESGWVGKRVGGEDVLSLTPDEAVKRLRDAKDSFDTGKRDVAEAFGVAIGKDISWGIRALESLRKSVHELTEEHLNPIWWGLRAATTEKKDLLKLPEVQSLIEAMQGLTRARPVPELWASIPSFLQTLVEQEKTKVSDWHEYGMELAELFAVFDFGREDGEGKPIEWLNRAINHPYGDLTEVYRDFAYTQVAKQVAVKAPPSLAAESRDFFEFTLNRWSKGTRYGVCLISERLSWIEQVDRGFASSQLIPIFDWNKSPEQAEVAWSGFLWGRALSKALTETFESTYLETAKRIEKLGDDEQKGLASHVAAVYWFEPKGLPLIQSFTLAATSEVRVEVLSGWETFLSQAELVVRARFGREFLFPYWDWCARQPFFQKSDAEKSAFFDLLPFLGDAFPAAVDRAQKYAPSALEHTYMLLKNLRESAAITFTNEYVSLLAKILEKSKNPTWESEEWQAIWKSLPDNSDASTDVLRNGLAKRGIQI